VSTRDSISPELLRRSVWPPYARTLAISTALRGHFNIPEGWRARASASQLLCGPTGLPFVPLRFACWQCDDSSYMQLERRLLTAFSHEGCAIVGRGLIRRPRMALTIDCDAHANGIAVRTHHIAELLDRGQLCAMFSLSDWRAYADVSLPHAAEVWRGALLAPPPLAQDARRIISEEGGFQFAFPEHWLIDHADGRMIVLRQPGRDRALPNLSVHSDYAPTRARSVESLAARISGISTEVDVGNRAGLHVLVPDAHARNIWSDIETHVIVPEPSAHASHVIQINALRSQRDEAIAIRNSFWWSAGPGNMAA
jgi:hypothetical protein